MSRPLVYLSKGVVQQAERILAHRCPENVISDAILNGKVTVGGGRAEIRGEGLRAKAVRVPGRIRRRPRAWLITGVEELTSKRRWI